MKKIYVSWQGVESLTQEILRQMQLDSWTPDYVVGLTRGGLVPANLISQYLGIPMQTLSVSLRDNESGPESNLWMSEDAFGYVSNDQRGESGALSDPSYRKKILIVDDINDSGATLNWIKNDWMTSCLPDHSAWNEIWGNNVKIATLYDYEASNSELAIDYSADTINKRSDPSWIVFPWEHWWNKSK
jgi:xanthine phosphoribosyltransferase